MKCFTCGGELCGWEATNDPWEEHAYWFPTCRHVFKCRGQEWIESLINLRRHESPPVVRHVLPVAIANQLNLLFESDVVRKYLQLGVPRCLLENSLKLICIRKARYFVTEEECIATMESILNVHPRRHQMLMRDPTATERLSETPTINCIICSNSPRAFAYVPCGHTVTCTA